MQKGHLLLSLLPTFMGSSSVAPLFCLVCVLDHTALKSKNYDLRMIE